MDAANPPADSGKAEAETPEKPRRKLTLASNRLFWALSNPFESAIQVMPGAYYDPNAPMEPYFRPGATPGVPGTWHPVSHELLTVPGLSSTTVSVWTLKDWEVCWLMTHEIHVDPGDFINPETHFAGTGELLDYDSDEEQTWDDFQVCCGTQRPRNQNVTLEVRATGEFITVHDFISAVHPWLMSLRETILEALRLTEEWQAWPADTKLVVWHLGPQLIDLRAEKDWFKDRMERPQNRVYAVPLDPSSVQAPNEDALDPASSRIRAFKIADRTFQGDAKE